MISWGCSGLCAGSSTGRSVRGGGAGLGKMDGHQRGVMGALLWLQLGYQVCAPTEEGRCHAGGGEMRHGPGVWSGGSPTRGRTRHCAR